MVSEVIPTAGRMLDASFVNSTVNVETEPDVAGKTDPMENLEI